MDITHLKIWLVYFIILTEGSVAKRRFRRYPTPPLPSLQPRLGFSLESFSAILNESIPSTCPENKPLRRFSLSTDSLQTLLLDKGGTILPSLMATEDNFKNLVNLGTFQNEDELDHIFPSTTPTVYKSHLEADLRKWNSLTNFLKSATSTSVGASHKNITERHRSMDYNDERKISDFLVQNNITLQQLLDYISSMKISTNPKILMGLDWHRNRRKKRNGDGSVSTQQFCTKQGSPTKNNLLSLCNECAVTTKLPPDRFPRLLNEVVCGLDLTCLSFQGKPQGACRTSETHLTLLRRRPGGCRMMIATGEEVFVDEWETYTQTVRTGCECSIDKRSFLIQHMDIHDAIVG